MATGPNQTGTVLQSSMALALGFGAGVTNQVQETDEERKNRLLAAASQTAPGVVSQSILGNMTGPL